MGRAGCQNVGITTYNQSSTEQKYTFQPPTWLRSIRKSLSSALWRDTACLPQHHTSSILKAPTTPNPNLPVIQRELYLLACMHRTEHHVVVNQGRVTEITTDRQLFRFMKTQYKRHRGRLISFFSLRRIQRIYFVKVSRAPTHLSPTDAHSS